MHMIAHIGCTDALRESALKVDSGRKIPWPHLGLKPASVLHLAIQADTLPAELFCTHISPGPLNWSKLQHEVLAVNHMVMTAD